MAPFWLWDEAWAAIEPHLRRNQPGARRVDDRWVILGIVLVLKVGNVSDLKAAPALLERADRKRYLLGDKGYDADRPRRSLRDTGTVPVVPGR